MTVHHFTHGHETSYHPPNKNVLLLSCMDPRLLDDVVDFMNHDNLTNRYDHLIFAGAALGALGAGKPEFKCFEDAFDIQLDAAIELHEIDDVYVIEHLQCGAYRDVFKVVKPKASLQEEAAAHLEWATRLKEKLEKKKGGHGEPLRVYTFLMDLRGDVVTLTPPPTPKEPLFPEGSSRSKKKGAKSKKRAT